MVHEGGETVKCPMCDCMLTGTYETLYATSTDGLVSCLSCGELFTIVKREDAYELNAADSFEYEDDRDDEEEEEEEEECMLLGGGEETDEDKYEDEEGGE